MLNLDNSKILVTGGLGFIGSNFITMIMEKYKNLHIINYDKAGYGSRKLYGNIRNSTIEFGNNSYKWIHGDLKDNICRISRIDHVLKNDKFDYVFHFAAESHVDRSINIPAPFVENNVMGMVNLLEAIRKHQSNIRLINISTDEVFGHLSVDDDPFTEHSPFAPRSPYAASKASADLIANSYVTTYGMDIVTTHCCNNFGPHQADEKFIPTVMRHLIKNEKIPLYGTGKNMREWIYVDDHNKSILEIAERGLVGQRYNIGSGIEYSNYDLICEIIKEFYPDMSTFDPDHYIKYVDDRKGHDFRYAIKSVCYFRNFETSNFHKSLALTIEHYRVKYSCNH
jgi:dTDP-glucose 4,6-dehydratase